MNNQPLFSICIPARNEERFITPCLEAIRRAERALGAKALGAKALGASVEIVVALNRCTDNTEQIAASFGCVLIREDAKNLSMIRNAAVKAARGQIVATIDADSQMSENMLVEIQKHIESGRVIGGGVRIMPERYSLGIIASGLVIALPILFLRISGGLFWFFKHDFNAIGGFNEALITGEDIDFAIRLKKYGKIQGKRFVNLYRAYILTSCRKFDEFGDWYFLNPVRLWKFARGTDRKVADRHWYDVKR